MAKVKVDPKKVIKVYPKMIRSDFSESNIWDIMFNQSAKKSKLKLPEIEDLTMSDCAYLKQYFEKFAKYFNLNGK